MSIGNHPFMQSTKEYLLSIYQDPLILTLLTIFLLIASYTDIKSMKIPNKLNGTFLAIRLFIIPIVGISIADLIGALFAFIALLIPAMIKLHKMGGDIKCLTVVGLYVGIYIIPFILLLSIIYFILYIIGSALFNKKVKNVPFAPFFFLSHITLIIISIII